MAPDKPDDTVRSSDDSSDELTSNLGPLLSQADLDALFAQPTSHGDSPNAAAIPPSETGEESSAPPDDPADSMRDGTQGIVGSEIDALLNDEDADRPLVVSDLDEVIGTPPPDADALLETGQPHDVSEAPEAVDQSDIDALIAMLDEDDATSVVAAHSGEVVSVPTDITIALPDAVPPPLETEAVSTENLAASVAPADTEPELVSQDILDSILAANDAPSAEAESPAPPVADLAAPFASPPQKRNRAPEETRVTPNASTSAPTPPEDVLAAPAPERAIGTLRRPRLPRFRAPANLLKITTSLAAGIIVAAVVFAYLYLHPYRQPHLPSLKAEDLRSLGEVMAEAGKLMEAGNFDRAIGLLDPAIAKAPESPERMDARYQRIEAAYRMLRPGPVGEETVGLRSAMLDVTAMEPTHPRAPEVLCWLADLHERAGAPYEARRLYHQLLAAYKDARNMDQILLGAARNANELRRRDEAADFARRLIEAFPASPLIGEAKLTLADAYAGANQAQAAQQMLEEEAQRNANSRLGAQAYWQLGKMAFDKGDYEEAIRQLERRLQTATTIQGNDAVYLLLGRSYRAAGRLAEAERVLRELIGFFPESAVIPEAYVELSQVVDQLGRRADAAQLAAQAAERFPDHAQTLVNHARFLRLLDQFAGAGAMHAAAYLAGGQREPALLVEAAKDYKNALDYARARQVLETLTSKFPETREAGQARIELAGLEYQEGREVQAIRRLENLLAEAEDSALRLAAMLAVAEMYQGIGLNAKAAEHYKKAAAITAEPETAARAAIAAFASGRVDEALVAARQIDPGALTPQTAYAFNTAYAKILLRADPARAIPLMEQARQDHPGFVAPEDDAAYLDALLVTDQTGKARVAVSELEQRAKQDPVDAARFQRAALRLADHYFNKGDFRAAADLYGQADFPRGATLENREWAQFQRANALLRTGNVDAGFAAYQRVAQSDSPWAPDAKIRMAHIDLQRRLGRHAEIALEPEPAALDDAPGANAFPPPASSAGPEETRSPEGTG